MDWFLDEILAGFQRLACLALERQPAAEVIRGTALAWVEALTHGRRWDQGRDAPRIREAFRTLAATRTSWPAPLHLIEALPRLEGVKALPARASDPERVQRMIDGLAQELKA